MLLNCFFIYLKWCCCYSNIMSCIFYRLKLYINLQKTAALTRSNTERKEDNTLTWLTVTNSCHCILITHGRNQTANNNWSLCLLVLSTCAAVAPVECTRFHIFRGSCVLVAKFEILLCSCGEFLKWTPSGSPTPLCPFNVSSTAQWVSFRVN